MGKVPAVERIRRAPSVVKLLKVPRVLVGQEILPEAETEWAKSFLSDCLEWAKVHIRVGVLGIKVRPWSNKTKESGIIEERLHLVLSIGRSVESGGSHRGKFTIPNDRTPITPEGLLTQRV